MGVEMSVLCNSSLISWSFRSLRTDSVPIIYSNGGGPGRVSLVLRVTFTKLMNARQKVLVQASLAY